MVEKKEKKDIDILLAEDDEFIRDIYSRIFDKYGYKIRTASDGVEALEKLKERTPDLILLDIMMPYQNGKEVYKKIMKNKKWSKIPVVFLTNLSSEDDIEQELVEGADKYLIKAHFTPKEVVEEVIPLIGSKKIKIKKWEIHCTSNKN